MWRAKAVFGAETQYLGRQFGAAGSTALLHNLAARAGLGSR